MTKTNIQNLIDKVNSGGTLKLDPPKQEYRGPIVIRKPIIIQGQNSYFSSKEKGPVLSIESDGVIVEDLNIAITGKESKLSIKEACALVVGQGKGVTLNNVTVQGNVLGLDEEEGDWRYPRSIKIHIRPGQSDEFKFRIIAPVPCSLKSGIAGLTVRPSGVKGGKETEITLKLEPLPQGVRLKGDIIIKTAFLSRRFEVTSQRAREGSEGICVIKHWWDTLAAKTPSSPVSRDSRTVSAPKTKPSSPPKLPKQGKKGPTTSGIPERITGESTEKPKPVSKPGDAFESKSKSESASKKIRQRPQVSIPRNDFWTQNADEPHKGQQKGRAVPTEPDTTSVGPVEGQTGKAASKEDRSAVAKGSTAVDSTKRSSSRKRDTVRTGDLSEAFSGFSPPADKATDKQKSKNADDKSEEEQQSEVAGNEAKSYRPKEPKVPKKRKTIKWDGGPTAFDSNTKK